MLISAFSVAFADATLEFVLVGAVAAILVIALALTLLSRSGKGGGVADTVGSQPFKRPSPPARARGDTQKKSDAPATSEPQSPPPAQPGYGAAPTPYAPPPPVAAYPSAPAAAPYPPAQAAPPAGYAQPAPAPKPEAAEPDGAPVALPTVDESYATVPHTEAPDELDEQEILAPSAGSSSSDIDWDAMEREIEREEAAEENAPAPPRRVPVVTPPDDADGDSLPSLSDVDTKRAEAPTAEELAEIEPAAGGDADDNEQSRGITLGGVAQEQANRAPAANATTAAALQFTSFYPREIPTQQWQTLLVYTHIADALNAVRGDALKFAEELGERPRVMNAAAAQPVERGTTLTIVPTCAGVRFNPERASLSWDEDWQRSNFRFSAGDELAGSAAAGEIAIYAGPLILAILKFGVLVSDTAQPDVTLNATQQQTAAPMTVFASYSHDDTSIALACRNAYKALGMTVNIDVDSLRSGDQWDPRLMQLIDGSDVFQLFWLSRAANSEAVQREWRYALAHSHGAGYIRPVYWEQPLIAPPAELSNVHFAYIDLPRE